MGPEILAALFPLITDGVKALFGKYIIGDNPKPTNINELLSLREADLKWFQAINEAGGTNPSYPWVEAIIRLQRPFVVLVTLITWALVYNNVVRAQPETVELVGSFARAVCFYLFGDRTLFYAQQSQAKKP